MRLHITLSCDRPIVIPVNYQEYLTAAVYAYVNAGDADYSRFVHDEGYLADGGKRFKPFTHSWLRIPNSRRQVTADRLRIAPGTIAWAVSSPLDEFLQPFASGLLRTGSLRIGSEALVIDAVQVIGTPEISSGMRMTCLSPMVASTRSEDGGTKYLRPMEDKTAFSEAIRKNVVGKFKALTGQEPPSKELAIAFDEDYLTRSHGGTKKVTYKNIEVIGILAPFTITGSPELIKLAYESGLGSKTACGFGCVEVRG
jgi:CRISPR-associated endoribonuclease Cas6